MKKEYFEKHYKNGMLTSCSPVGLKLISFIYKDTLQNDDEDKEPHEMPTRLIVFKPETNKLGFFGTRTWESGIDNLFVSNKNSKWVVCDKNFSIEEPIQNTGWYNIPNNEIGHLAKGITTIDGDVYAYGMVRSVFKRTATKKWENITSEEKHPNLYIDVKESEENFVGDWVGFSALDGFDQNNIYAGGNRGDFWHFNGNKWSQKDLPINSDISTIVCASNGLVYIGSRIGSVLVGRDDIWSVIDESKQITHSSWFQNRIYFAAKNGRIYTHEEGDGSLIEATFKSQYPDYMHHRIVGMASCDNCLVVYTEKQAYAYDGDHWHEIIEIPSLSKII